MKLGPKEIVMKDRSIRPNSPELEPRQNAL